MKKRLIALTLALVTILFCFAGCKAEQTETTPPTETEAPALTEAPAETAAPAEINFSFDMSIGRSEDAEVITQTVTKVPEKVLCLSYEFAAMMVDLGLEDHIAAVAMSEGPTSSKPGIVEKMLPLKCLGSVWELSKEQVLAEGTDFIISWDTFFTEKFFAPQFCQDNGIIMYSPYCTHDGADSIEEIYRDYETLGIIFGVEEVAAQRIEEMKAVMASVETALKDVKEPVRVFDYDSGDDDAFTACKGLPGAIFEAAGADSVFGDIDKGWARVSWEEIVARDPEVILINNYSGDESEFNEKKEFLESMEALKNVTAIKEGRIFSIPTNDIEGAAGTVYLIEDIAQMLYPELF